MTPTAPHIHIENISLQPLEIGKPIQFLVYYKSDGGSSSIEYSYYIATTDHLTAPEHRDELETSLFTHALQLMDSRNGRFFVDVGPGEDLSETWNIENPAAADFLHTFNAGGPLYLTAVFRYVGHPELPEVEICRYWVLQSKTRSMKCHSHDTP
jgi:hypothetical protein